MRKRQISPTPRSVPASGQAWLDVEHAALVEVTSEEKGYPIESALLEAESPGWRAANPGPQTIRLVFDEPQKIRRIWLVFEDSENTRTQEFVLRWSPATGNVVTSILTSLPKLTSKRRLPSLKPFLIERKNPLHTVGI
jgi:hypothetical protein